MPTPKRARKPRTLNFDSWLKLEPSADEFYLTCGHKGIGLGFGVKDAKRIIAWLTAFVSWAEESQRAKKD